MAGMGVRDLAVDLPPWASERPPPEAGQAHISCVALGRGAPAAARRRVRLVLDDWQVPAETSDTVALLLCELVTNAVKFGRPMYGVVPDDIGLALWLHDGCVVIEVTDESMSLPFLRDADADSESGRGLRLVEALSERWGYYVPGRGRKTVYCVVRVGGYEGTGAGG